MNFYIGYVTSTLKSTRYPWANVGDYVFHNQHHNNGDNGLFIINSGSHNQKNFSIGADSVGKHAYDAYVISSNTADLVGTLGYDNHNADGSLKYIFGNTGGNYVGPIGNRVWFFFEDFTPTNVADIGGRASFTLAGHNIPTGSYVMVKNYAHWGQVNTTYSGYWYLESTGPDTFQLRKNADIGSAYCMFAGNISVKMSITVGASKMQNIDAIGTESNKVIITNAPGSQMIFRKHWESTANYGWEFFGAAKHVIMSGEYDPVLGIGDTLYRGHRDGYAFSYGKYGIWIQFYNKLTNNPILYISNGATNWEVKFIEIDGGGRGFAGIMMKSDNAPSQNMDDMRIHDCYIHDMEGEGCYIGNTGDNTAGSAPLQHWVKLWMYNCRFARTGVEINQTGQLKDGSIIENNVYFIADLTHHKPFFLGQSNFAQLKDRTGKIIFRNNMLICGAVNAMLIQSNRANETAPSEVIIENTFFSDGMFRISFFSQVNALSGYVQYRNCYFKDILPYNTDRLESQSADEDELWLTTQTNPTLKLNGVIFDTAMNVRSVILSGGATDSLNLAQITYASVASPGFKRTGMEGMGDIRNLHEYFQTYSATHPTHPSQNIAYVTSDRLTYEGLFYRVNTAFSGGNAPPTNANCTQIFWDSNGWNSLHGSYNGTPYSCYPPDDFRLAANDVYNEKGMGLLDNEDNTNNTETYWEAAYNNGSGSPDLSFVRKIKMFRNKRLLKADMQKLLRTGVSGKTMMVRRVMVAKNATLGTLSAVKPSNVWLPI